MGIVLSGTGVGGVFWAPVLRLLNTQIGFRNTLRVSGGVSFLMVCAAASVLRWDPATQRRITAERSQRRLARISIPLVNWHIARTRPFIAQALGAVCQAAAYYTPIYFFSAYASQLGYSAAAGANFISASNGASALGKVMLGYIADRCGRINTLVICTLIAAAATLGLWVPSTVLVDSDAAGEQKARTLFAAFSVVYGIFAGAYVSLFPTALVELFGVQHFTSVNGFLYMLRGIASLIGTPTAGALLRGGGKEGSAMVIGYEKLSSMVGTLMAGAAVATFWVRFETGALGGWKWRV
jgi:MFS family permease